MADKKITLKVPHDIKYIVIEFEEPDVVEIPIVEKKTENLTLGLLETPVIIWENPGENEIPVPIIKDSVPPVPPPFNPRPNIYRPEVGKNNVNIPKTVVPQHTPEEEAAMIEMLSGAPPKSMMSPLIIKPDETEEAFFSKGRM